MRCWTAGVVICLQRNANDLHIVHLMPLPANHLLLCYNPEWLSGTGLPRLSWKHTQAKKRGKEAVKWL